MHKVHFKDGIFYICFCLTNVESQVHHWDTKHNIGQCIAKQVSQYKLNDPCTPISTYYASQNVQAEARDYI